MFGPVDVAAPARGEYRQIYDGRATTAHIAFIDEIFKCSTAALNETLGYLNERIYHPESGGEPIRGRPLRRRPPVGVRPDHHRPGRAAVPMITDDDCGVTEEWMRGWKESKHRLGFRVFGVAVGAPRVAATDSVLDALCDNLRSVEDLTDVHATADLFRVI